MAHAKADLTPSHYHSNGKTQWVLQTADAIATVAGANYLNASHERLKISDLILIYASDSVAFRRVSNVAAGVVTIAALG